MLVTESLILADRIVVTNRWVILLGLMAFLGWNDVLNQYAMMIMTLGGLWNLGLTIMSLAIKRLPFHRYVTISGDAILGMLLFFNVSLQGAPTLWGFLLPLLTSSFYLGVRGGLVVAIGAVVLGQVGLPAGFPFERSLELMGPPSITLIGTGLLSGFLAQQIGYLLRNQRAIEVSQQLEAVRIERERNKAIYTITSKLNSTLNYEQVLDMSLDLSGSALASESSAGRVVSAFLLYEGDELRVGSARRFTPGDFRTVLPGKEGIIGKAVDSGLPKITRNPSQDPEINRIVALRNCSVTYCYPLRTNLEIYGVLLFGHPDKDFFDDAQLEILEIIGTQVMVALQNARLYRELEDEKERMMEIQEEARKKLARDLHDGPTQSVAALAMRVNFARRLMDRDVKAAGDELFKIEDLARRTTKEIRHMLFTLRPLILESEGLLGALKSMAGKMQETFDQNVIIDVDPKVVYELEMGKQGVIFYIAEEAVNNARKHAEAENIWVRLKFIEENVSLLEIQDNGVGFNVGSVNEGYEHRGSLGMVNMRERTELVNGVLRLESEEGRGTLVRVWIPLNEEGAIKLRHGG